jgi:hypothetical protein
VLLYDGVRPNPSELQLSYIDETAHSIVPFGSQQSPLGGEVKQPRKAWVRAKIRTGSGAEMQRKERTRKLR